MILIDSSVWIDYFREAKTAQSVRIDHLISRQQLAVGDLILVEVLQGCVTDREFRLVHAIMTTLDIITISDRNVAIHAARNYRHLRARGITVRKTINPLIATRCIRDGHSLLYSDRDFDPFVAHLGLRSAMA